MILIPPTPEQSIYVCAPEFLERKKPDHSTLVPSTLETAVENIPFRSTAEDPQSYCMNFSEPDRRGLPEQYELLKKFQFNE
jgi:hypothetical protein